MRTFIKHPSQVGYWLEELHDRRVDVTRIHDRIKEKLNRKLKSLDIAVMIDQYSTVVQDIRRRVEKVDTVGGDVVSCQDQISQMSVFERNIQEVSEKCLKLVSLCDTLDQSLYGDISMECSLHGYDILQLCTELLQLVDLKTDIITRHLGLVVDYNNSCNKLGQIEDNIQSQATTGAAAQDFSGEIKIILDSFLVKGRACLDNSSDMASPAG